MDDRKSMLEIQADAMHVRLYDPECERAVLGTLMLDNTALALIEDILRPSDFHSPVHALLYETMIALHASQRPIDIYTLVENLRRRDRLNTVGGAQYLGELTDSIATTAHVESHAQILSDLAVRRRMVLAAQELIVRAMGGGSGGTAEFISSSMNKLEEASRRSGGGKMRTYREVVASTLKRMEATGNDAPVRVKTGLVDLDLLLGGFKGGWLYVVGARPAMGKSAFALLLAHKAAEDRRGVVMVFGLEMEPEENATRWAATVSNTDGRAVMEGRACDEDFEAFGNALVDCEDLPVLWNATDDLSIDDIGAMCVRQTFTTPVTMVVIDYLTLLRMNPDAERHDLAVADVSRKSKLLAKRLGCPVVLLSQLNRKCEERGDKRPLLSDLRDCVTGDTLVCLADGRRAPIASLVGQTPDVFAMTPDGLVCSARSDLVWSVGVRPITAVTLASGRRIRATERHRLLGAEGWVRVGDVKVGDRLALARRLPEPAGAGHWNFARLALLGQMIGDGSFLVHQPMRYTTASEENSELVASTARDEFGAVVKRYVGRGKWHQLLISGNGNAHHPAGVNKWLREIGIYGQRSHEKRIPAEVFALGNAEIAVLLRHLWATDGSIWLSKAGADRSSRVFFATCSEGLARDVAALLLRMEIVARIRVVHQRTNRDMYTVDVSGADAQRVFLDRVGAFGPRVAPAEALRVRLLDVEANGNVDTMPREVFAQVRREMKARGVSHREMASRRGVAYRGSAHYTFAPSRAMVSEYAEILDSDSLKSQASGDVFWDRVVSVEPAGEENVFDLTVPGPASWLADGVVSHNCGAIEQDANCVIALYRDEVYHKDTDDKGVAEVIVLKHRGGPTGTARVGWIPSRTSFVNLQADDGAPAVAYSSRNRGGRRSGAAQPASHAHQAPPAATTHTSDGCDPWENGEGLPMENAPVFPGEQASMRIDQ